MLVFLDNLKINKLVRVYQVSSWLQNSLLPDIAPGMVGKKYENKGELLVTRTVRHRLDTWCWNW